MRIAIAMLVVLATLGTAATATPEDLISAIRTNGADEVKRLLDRGVDPSAPATVGGLPPLFEAVTRGNSDIVRALLNAGADMETIYRNDRGEIHSAYSYAVRYANGYVLSVFNSHGGSKLGDRFMRNMQRLVCSPDYCGNVLTMAALYGGRRPKFHLRSAKDKEAYRSLLSLQGTVSDHPDIRGRPLLPPLHAAALKASPITIEILLRAGADIDQRDNKGLTAIDHARANDLPVIVALFEAEQRARQIVAAIESGDAGRVKQLLADGTDPNDGGANSRPPLAVAANTGHVEIARILLARGARVELEDMYQRTSIMFAIDAGNLAVVQLLLANGASMDGQTMKKAAESGNEDIVLAFLDAGADPTVPYYGSGPQPIHFAIQNGHVGIFRLLAAAGADIHAEWISEAEGNYTTLSDAIAHDQTDIALELIEKGADTDVLICPGEAACRSYLAIAASRGNVALVRRLIAAGNEVRRSQQDLMLSDGMIGMSPLMWAARNGNPEAVAILVKHGADVSLRNNFDCSALDYAMLNNRDEAAAILRKAGATTDQTTCQSWYFK